MATFPTFDQRELAGHITITVQFKRDWRFPLGAWFMRFGAWLAGVNLRVEGDL